jgi:hypothetical protein
MVKNNKSNHNFRLHEIGPPPEKLPGKSKGTLQKEDTHPK